MRVDKFLQLTGLIKRRSLAKKLCEVGRILVNNKVAKASTKLKEGDILAGEVMDERWKVRILQIPKQSNISKKQLGEFIEILERKTKFDFEQQKF